MKKRPAVTSCGLLAALLAAGRAGALDDAEDFVLAHDQKLLAVDLDLRAAVLAEQHAVAGLHVKLLAGAALPVTAPPHGDDLALLRLFLRGVGDDDAAPNLLALLDAAQDYAVVKRSDVGSHANSFPNFTSSVGGVSLIAE